MQIQDKPEVLDFYGLTPIKGQAIYRFLHVTDIHKSPLGRIPSSRSQSYHSDCSLENLALAEAIRALSADVVVNSGDLFHLKAQSVYQPESLNHHAEEIRLLRVPFISIPGNHDMPSSSYEELGKSAYYNVMKQTPNAIDLGTTVDEEGKTALAPSSHTVKVENGQTSFPINFYGIPYMKRDRLLEQMAKLNEDIGDSFGLNVVLLHGDFFPDGYNSPFFDPISYSILSQTLSNASIFCLGHIHQSYPVAQLAGPKRTQYISKPWSMGRVVKDYHATTDVLEHQHKPSFSCITVYIGEDGNLAVDIQYGTIPHKGFKESFMLDSVREEIKDSQQMHDYIAKLRASSASQSLTPEEYLNNLGDSIEQEVRDLILYHIQKAE